MITQKQIDTRNDLIDWLMLCIDTGSISATDSHTNKLLEAIADADKEAHEYCTAPDITYCKAEIGKTECGRNCKWYKERIAEN